MWDSTYNCPTCGAPLPVKNRFVRLAACDFCGNLCTLTDEGPAATGMVSDLAPLPTAFYLDARGTLDGRRFTVLGRLRYQYEAGQWDEWFLGFDDGEPGWLEEDEGEYVYYGKVDATEAAPAIDGLRAGQTVRIPGQIAFMVTEIGEAQIIGGEGQLAFAILPGERVRFVDGSAEGSTDKISLEYAADEIELCIGRALPRDAVQVEQEVF